MLNPQSDLIARVMVLAGRIRELEDAIGRLGSGLDRVAKAGDAMFGPLLVAADAPGQIIVHRAAGLSAWIGIGDDADTIVGLVGKDAAGNILLRAGGGRELHLGTNAVTQMRIAADGTVTTGPLRSDAARVVAMQGAHAPLAIASSSGIAAYMGFHPSAVSVDNLGTRRGALGPTSTTVWLVDAESTSELRMNAAAAATLFVGGVERARAAAGGFLVGKSSFDVGTAGVEFTAEGRISATRTTNTYCFTSNRKGAADVNGGIHFGFLHADALAGSVTRTGATTVAFNTSSDDLLKDDSGEIDPETAAYVMRLIRPHWYRWWADGESGPIISGYLARRVAELWPGAVDQGVVTPGEGTPADEEAWRLRHAAWQRRSRVAALVEQRNQRVAERFVRAVVDTGAEWSESASGLLVPAAGPSVALWAVPAVGDEEPNPYRPWMMDLSKMTPVLHAAWIYDSERVDELDLDNAALRNVLVDSGVITQRAFTAARAELRHTVLERVAAGVDLPGS